MKMTNWKRLTVCMEENVAKDLRVAAAHEEVSMSEFVKIIVSHALYSPEYKNAYRDAFHRRAVISEPPAQL
jgi:hypothetical protein